MLTYDSRVALTAPSILVAATALLALRRGVEHAFFAAAVGGAGAPRHAHTHAGSFAARVAFTKRKGKKGKEKKAEREVNPT